MFDPTLFVFNVEKRMSRVVKGVPKDLSVGQIVWTPGGLLFFSVVVFFHESCTLMLHNCQHSVRAHSLNVVLMISDLYLYSHFPRTISPHVFQTLSL